LLLEFGINKHVDINSEPELLDFGKLKD